MNYYYVALLSRSHAFLLERRLKSESIECELTYMPREIMIDLCNLGVRFPDYELKEARDVLRSSGLPGCRLFKEVITPDESKYYEVHL